MSAPDLKTIRIFSKNGGVSLISGLTSRKYKGFKIYSPWYIFIYQEDIKKPGIGIPGFFYC